MPSNKNVQYIDFGYISAKEFWGEVVLPAYERFKAMPNRQNALQASIQAWHVHEWIWHDQHPGEDTRGNSDYQEFRAKVSSECPEVLWIRDVADASKHRGLGRQPTVERVASGRRFVGAYGTGPYGVGPYGGHSVATPLAIVLTDGTTHGFAEILSRVVDYWQVSWFA